MRVDGRALEGAAGSAGRLFLGVAVPDEIRRGLAADLREIGLPGRPVPPGNWHLTIAFLGDVPRDALQRLEAELGQEDFGNAFNITFRGLGAFPRADRASVLWVGIGEGADAMRELAERVRSAVRRAGVAADERPYRPHLTLSRIRPPRDVRRLVEGAPAFGQRMQVEEVALFRSHLGGGPARYEAIERFRLGAE